MRLTGDKWNYVCYAAGALIFIGVASLLRFAAGKISNNSTFNKAVSKLERTMGSNSTSSPLGALDRIVKWLEMRKVQGFGIISAAELELYAGIKKGTAAVLVTQLNNSGKIKLTEYGKDKWMIAEVSSSPLCAVVKAISSIRLYNLFGGPGLIGLTAGLFAKILYFRSELWPFAVLAVSIPLIFAAGFFASKDTNLYDIKVSLFKALKGTLKFIGEAVENIEYVRNEARNNNNSNSTSSPISLSMPEIEEDMFEGISETLRESFKSHEAYKDAIRRNSQDFLTGLEPVIEVIKQEDIASLNQYIWNQVKGLPIREIVSLTDEDSAKLNEKLTKEGLLSIFLHHLNGVGYVILGRDYASEQTVIKAILGWERAVRRFTLVSASSPVEKPIVVFDYNGTLDKGNPLVNVRQFIEAIGSYEKGVRFVLLTHTDVANGFETVFSKNMDARDTKEFISIFDIVAGWNMDLDSGVFSWAFLHNGIKAEREIGSIYKEVIQQKIESTKYYALTESLKLLGIENQGILIISIGDEAHADYLKMFLPENFEIASLGISGDALTKLQQEYALFSKIKTERDLPIFNRIAYIDVNVGIGESGKIARELIRQAGSPVTRQELEEKLKEDEEMIEAMLEYCEMPSVLPEHTSGRRIIPTSKTSIRQPQEGDLMIELAEMPGGGKDSSSPIKVGPVTPKQKIFKYNPRDQRYPAREEKKAEEKAPVTSSSKDEVKISQAARDMLATLNQQAEDASSSPAYYLDGANEELAVQVEYLKEAIVKSGFHGVKEKDDVKVIDAREKYTVDTSENKFTFMILIGRRLFFAKTRRS